MVDTATFSLAAQVVIALVLLVGFAYLVFQQMQLQRQRMEAEQNKLLHAYTRDPTLADHIRALERLPNENVVDYVNKHPLVQPAIDGIYQMNESLGFLVHERMLSLEKVSTLFGGAILAMWEKLEPLARHEREVSGREGRYEWSEWLVHQLRTYTDPSARGNALERHGDWRP